MSTRDGHVSRVWEHVHEIPSKILPYFDPSHSPIAHQEAELEIIQNLEQSTQPLHRLYKLPPLLTSNRCERQVTHIWDTGHMSTCEGHVSRV